MEVRNGCRTMIQFQLFEELIAIKPWQCEVQQE